MQRPDVTAIVDRQVAAGSFDGAALVVRRGDLLLLEHFAGNAAPGLPSGPEVLWPLASITKLYTAATVMRLVELGEVTVNTPVWHVLPRFRGDGRDHIRVRTSSRTHRGSRTSRSRWTRIDTIGSSLLVSISYPSFMAARRSRPGSRSSRPPGHAEDRAICG